MKTSKKVNDEIDGVMGLRIKIWFESVLAASKQNGIPSLINFFEFQQLVTVYSTWSRYKNGEIEPKLEFINKIDSKLPGTAEVFHSGPDGFPLWEILNENADVCLQVIDDEIFRVTCKLPDETWSFHERVMVIFSLRFPRDIDLQKLWDLISTDRSKELHEEFNVLALTSKDVLSVDDLPKMLIGKEEHWENLFGKDWNSKFSPDLVTATGHSIIKDSSVITLGAGQVITTIALYVLSRKKNELVPHCHYLMKGVIAKAAREQLSFGTSISEFMNTDKWTYQKLQPSD
ncbi:hypothetical protein ACO0KY_12375 [Undibacterium sp. Dicai25W]|uniref:hypothetical protein n=1 Tax=Undibacterium sp. Dicai25W TaxID=3413034 RepID=UPI003BF06A81